MGQTVPWKIQGHAGCAIIMGIWSLSIYSVAVHNRRLTRMVGSGSWRARGYGVPGPCEKRSQQFVARMSLSLRNDRKPSWPEGRPEQPVHAGINGVLHSSGLLKRG